MMIREETILRNLRTIYVNLVGKNIKIWPILCHADLFYNLREKTHDTSGENIKNICHLRHVCAYFLVRFSLFSSFRSFYAQRGANHPVYEIRFFVS